MKRLIISIAMCILFISLASSLNNCKDHGFKIRGDANNDGEINISDVIFISNFLFNPTGIIEFCNGELYYEPADPNGDNQIDLADISFLIDWLYNYGIDPLPLSEKNEEIISLSPPSLISPNRTLSNGREVKLGDKLLKMAILSPLDNQTVRGIIKIESLIESVNTEVEKVELYINKLKIEGGKIEEPCFIKDLFKMICKTRAVWKYDTKNDNFQNLEIRVIAHAKEKNLINEEKIIVHVENISEETKIEKISKDEGCLIEKASWESESAEEGQNIKLIIETNSFCEDKTIEFETLEKDIFFDDPTKTKPQATIISGGKAVSKWRVEKDFDGILNNLEYYFKAKIKNTEISLESNILKVV